MLEKIENLILDMDGVLWRGDTPMPGLQDFFETLRRLDIDYILATNNATKTPGEYTAKLARMGLEVPPSKILTSAVTTASYLAREYPSETAVYVIGTESLRDIIAAQGFTLVSVSQAEAGQEAQLVVLGFTPQATYWELAMGALLVEKGARFIGTNPDPSIPHELGPLPGAGALQAVIVAATGVQPMVIGKPGPAIFEEALRRLSGSHQNTAMVGDRLSTDIAGAKSAGLAGILLLSGIASSPEMGDSTVQPDYVFADINELARALEASKGGKHDRA